MAEDWEQHRISAEYALENLSTEQISTTAMMLALQVGSYRKVHGDKELEMLEKYEGVSELDEEGKEIFLLGMQALLETVRKIEMSGAERH